VRGPVGGISEHIPRQSQRATSRRKQVYKLRRKLVPIRPKKKRKKRLSPALALSPSIS